VTSSAALSDAYVKRRFCHVLRVQSTIVSNRRIMLCAMKIMYVHGDRNNPNKTLFNEPLVLMYFGQVILF